MPLAHRLSTVGRQFWGAQEAGHHPQCPLLPSIQLSHPTPQEVVPITSGRAEASSGLQAQWKVGLRHRKPNSVSLWVVWFFFKCQARPTDLRATQVQGPLRSGLHPCPGSSQGILGVAPWCRWQPQSPGSIPEQQGC